MGTRVKQAVAIAIATVWMSPAYCDVIKVGVIGTMSGPYALFGQNFRSGIDAWVAEQGSKVGDHQIEFVYRDEESPNPAKSKAEILAYLRDSFAMIDKVIADTNAENLLHANPGPYWGSNRLSALNAALWHISDHYGQLVIYLRMNGIVPPASRKLSGAGHPGVCFSKILFAASIVSASGADLSGRRRTILGKRRAYPLSCRSDCIMLLNATSNTIFGSTVRRKP